MAFIIITLIVVLMFLFLTTYFSFSWGFVLYKFWYWFLIPVFTELPEISFWAAVGLMMFVTLFKNHGHKPAIKEEYINKSKQSGNAFASFLTPWMVLLIGFVIKTIIG